ncbi:MAG: serine/threonine protein kinase [Actinomycetota bacterium]|nr:serine/threonine protein kinase [Actinomycetota bacterium]
MELFLAGRYRTAELLGTGGTASVYRALDENLGRDVAVKLFAPSMGNDDDLHRQQTETQLLATLTHPGLVTLHDAGVHPDGTGAFRSFLVMELIQGPDLRQLLAAGGFTTDETAQLGADIADALHYVHQHAVIHRDVKPANILMASSSQDDTRLHPLLSDFGIARMMEATAATVTGTTLGTANYLSPEQALAQNVTTASDIYSLGLVLLECLTGQKAFPGPTLEAAVARLARDPEIPDSLGAEWVGLLVAMTARNPELRPTAHDVAVALRVQAQQPVAPSAGDSGPDLAASDDDGLPTAAVAYRAAEQAQTPPAGRHPAPVNGPVIASAGDPFTGPITGGYTTDGIRIPQPPNRAPSAH